MEYDTTLSLKIDKQTMDFLDALRDQESINISAWVREAIRAKAGLLPNRALKTTPRKTK